MYYYYYYYNLTVIIDIGKKLTATNMVFILKNQHQLIFNIKYVYLNQLGDTGRRCRLDVDVGLVSEF
jgi:hypothetical protein